MNRIAAVTATLSRLGSDHRQLVQTSPTRFRTDCQEFACLTAEELREEFRATILREYDEALVSHPEALPEGSAVTANGVPVMDREQWEATLLAAAERNPGYAVETLGAEGADFEDVSGFTVFRTV